MRLDGKYRCNEQKKRKLLCNYPKDKSATNCFSYLIPIFLFFQKNEFNIKWDIFWTYFFWNAQFSIYLKLLRKKVIWVAYLPPQPDVTVVKCQVAEYVQHPSWKGILKKKASASLTKISFPHLQIFLRLFCSMNMEHDKLAKNIINIVVPRNKHIFWVQETLNTTCKVLQNLLFEKLHR